MLTSLLKHDPEREVAVRAAPSRGEPVLLLESDLCEKISESGSENRAHHLGSCIQNSYTPPVVEITPITLALVKCFEPRSQPIRWAFTGPPELKNDLPED